MQIELTATQARRAATCIAGRIFDMDQDRDDDWYKRPAQDSLTASDQAYRLELQEAYNAIMSQLPR